MTGDTSKAIITDHAAGRWIEHTGRTFDEIAPAMSAAVKTSRSQLRKTGVRVESGDSFAVNYEARVVFIFEHKGGRHRVLVTVIPFKAQPRTFPGVDAIAAALDRKRRRDLGEPLESDWAAVKTTLAHDRAILAEAYDATSAVDSGLPDRLSVVAAAVAAERARCLAIVRQRWTFSSGQQHTHSWHDMADAVEAIRKGGKTP